MINLVTLDPIFLLFLLIGLFALLLIQIFFLKSFESSKKQIFIFSVLFSLVPIIFSIFVNQYYLAGTGTALRYGWPSAFLRGWTERVLTKEYDLVTLLFSNPGDVIFLPLQFIANLLFYSFLFLNIFGLIKKVVKMK